MYTLAITRWGAPLEQELGHFAQLMSMAPYDARLKLAGPLPVVIATRAPEELARRMLDSLRARGHGVVVCEQATIPTPDRVLLPRGFEFNTDAFVAIDPAGRRYPVPYAEILGLLRATQVMTESSVAQTVEKKFSLQRAALSGGIVTNKKVVKTERSESTEHEQVLYLFRASMPDPMRLHETGLRYDGLGEHRGPTRLQCFNTVVQWLRGHASQAIYDESMLRRKRRATGLAVQLTKTDQVVQISNQNDNDVAAYLLMHAHVQGQL